MAPRFDGERLALELSVNDLLDGALLRNLGFASRGGYERLWLGQAIHSRYQEQTLAEDPSYRREVVVSATFDHRGWEVTIHGRLDGLRRDPDGTRVVEEIKSVRRGGQLSPAQKEIYERQAQLYAWLLHRGDEQPVRAELVLIEIGREEVERVPLALDLRATDAGVRRRLNSLIRLYEAERQAEEERRAAAGRLAFPYPALRPGQEEIVAAVETARRQPRARADRGHHRHRQDGRRPLPRPPLRPRPRQAPLRPHRQDPAAGDGDDGRSSCSTRRAPSTACGCGPRRRCAPTTR